MSRKNHKLLWTLNKLKHPLQSSLSDYNREYLVQGGDEIKHSLPSKKTYLFKCLSENFLL